MSRVGPLFVFVYSHNTSHWTLQVSWFIVLLTDFLGRGAGCEQCVINSTGRPNEIVLSHAGA